MSVKDIIPFLKTTNLFGEISARGLALIAKQSKENRFRKGDIVFSEGDSGETLHLIKSGKVKITKYNKDGKTKTLAILREKDSFGEMAILTKDVRSATVESLSDLVTVSISREDFEALIKQEPSIPIAIIKTLSERLAKADRDIKNLALGDARARIACVMLDLINDIATTKFTHQEIADLAGLTRETTTRTLKLMEDEGLLQITDRKIQITDLERLKELCV